MSEKILICLLLCCLATLCFAQGQSTCTLWLYKNKPSEQFDPKIATQITFSTVPNGEGIYYQAPFSDGSNSIPWVRYFAPEGEDCTYCNLVAVNADVDVTLGISIGLITYGGLLSYRDGGCFKEFRIVCDENDAGTP